MNGAPRQRCAASTSPAAISALIRVEETVSPSTSTSGTTRVVNSERAASISGSPFALAPKRKFSPTETLSAPSREISTSSMKLSALRVANSSVEGDDDELGDPQAVDQVPLDAERGDQLRQRRGVQDLERVGLEGEHGVRPLDHRLVADVDAVEGPDRDPARARLARREAASP